jgi:hypothetical protein
MFGKNISRFILLICELRLKYKCEEIVLVYEQVIITTVRAIVI